MRPNTRTLSLKSPDLKSHGSNAAFMAALSAGLWAAMAPLAHAGGEQVTLTNYVARVEVIPEERSDVAVSVSAGNPKLPVPKVTRALGRTIVDGGIRNDKHFFGINITITGGEIRPGGMVGVKGYGQFLIKDLPLITVRTPMQVKLSSEGTGFGHIGRSETLDLSDSNNGDWRVDPVMGKVSASSSGAGDIHLATAGEVEISSSGSGDFTVGDIQALKSAQAGSGDISVGRVFGPAELSLAGSGDARLAGVRGPVEISIAGSGDVRINEGVAPKFSVSIAGSGDVSFGGTAGDVDVSIAGSGDVSVARATGHVEKNVIGSGDVRVGR
jgi:hypothetical protein